MVVLEIKWENNLKKERYEVSDEFYDKLIKKVEVADRCNVVPVNPNRIILHNTDEMIDFFKSHCEDIELVEKFSNRPVVLGTVIEKLVIVDRIFIQNNYNAPIHSIEGDYAYLYKKGKDWASLGGQKWSKSKTYKVKISDKALLRVPIVTENMVTAEEKFKHDTERYYKGKIAFAYVSVMAETNEFVVQHLFKDVFEWNNWKDGLIPTEHLYK